MEYRLSNDLVTVRVDSKGAQLMSLYSNSRRKEYLWQGDPVYWGDRAPLLFPACSRIAGDRITVEGQEYFLPVQGFAKNMEFAPLEVAEDRLVLELASNEKTLSMFPYPFRLQIAFSLEGEKVIEKFTVINDGERDMYFSIGSHPGFFCPIDLHEKTEDYVLEFDCDQNIYRFETEDFTKLLLHETSPFIVGKELPLSDSFFADGPKLLGGLKAGWIRLKSKKSGQHVEMSIEGFPYMALWGLNKRMTFICLEPWCGTSDFVDTDHDWEKKPGNVQLAPGKQFERELRFSFN